MAGHSRKKGGRKPLDPALPRVEVRHELPESERVCPHDDLPLVEIGVELSEQLDIVLQQIRVLQHQRAKYTCPRCDLSTNRRQCRLERRGAARHGGAAAPDCAERR